MKKKKEAGKQTYSLALGKKNYYLIIVAFMIIILGFMLISGGGSEDPNVFDEKRIFSFRRSTLAPVIILSGFMLIIFAILKKFK